MKLEEAIKFLREGKKITLGNNRSIKFDCELEFFEETFVLTKEDIFSNDWEIQE